MDLGIGFLGERMTIAEKVYYSQAAERSNFASAWTAEHYFGRDSIVTTTAILTKTTKLKAGTAVVNPYTRHPSLLAMSSATLTEASGGRFILGLGSSMRNWIEGQMFIPCGSPASSLLEAFQIVREMLDGRKSTFMGKRFSVSNVKMDFGKDVERTPIYLAAVGPKMLRKSAELADGIIMSTGSTPRYIRWAMPQVKSGLPSSKAKDFGVVCLVCLGVRKDTRRALRDMRPWLLAPLLRPGRAELVLPDNSVIQEAREQWLAGNVEAAYRAVPDDVLNSLCICGDVDDCVRGIDDYRGLGLTDLVLTPISFEKELLLKLIKRLSTWG